MALPLDEKMQAVLLKVRKKAVSAFNTVGSIKKILDALGGWKIEPIVELVDQRYDGKPEFFYAQDKEEALAKWQDAKRLEVRSLPANPKPEVRYFMNVTDPKPHFTGGAWGFEAEVWQASPGFKFTSPEGKKFDLLHHRYDRDFSLKYLRVYDLWAWLFKETSLLRQVNEALDTEEHAPSMPRTRENTGTCPCCFRNIKLKSDGKSLYMVLHGYQRPGWGSVQGQCFGVYYKPFELSVEGTVALREHLEKEAAEGKKRLSDLEGGRVKQLPARDRSGRPVMVREEDARWDQVLRFRIAEEKALLSSIESDLKTIEPLIRNWKEEPLPEAGAPARLWKNGSAERVASQWVGRVASESK